MKIQDLLVSRGWQIVGRSETRAPSAKSYKPDEAQLLGHLIKSRVLEINNDGRVMLRIAEHEVPAKSQIPLKVGQELWLEARLSGNSVILSQAAKKGATYEALKNLLRDQPAGANTITSLVRFTGAPRNGATAALYAKYAPLFRFLSALDAGQPPDLVQLLEALILQGKGGKNEMPQSFRAGYVDFINGLLAQLKGAGEKTVGTGKGLEIGGLERLLGLLESINQMNSQPSSQGQFPYLLFPYFFAAQNGFGTWLLNFDEQSGQEGAESYQTLRFYLEMSWLGQVQVQARLVKNGVQGKIFLDDDRMVSHVRNLLPDLHENLGGLGYDSVYFQCAKAMKPMLQDLKEELERLADMPSLALLDVKV